MPNLVNPYSFFNPTSIPNLTCWIDNSLSSKVTKAYQTLSATGSGTSGTTTITSTSNIGTGTNSGCKIRIGATDIYTISGISGTTITTIETLTSTYGAGSALALDKESQILDITSNGNNAVQATASAQPIYCPAGINGKDVIVFDTANNPVLQIPSSTTMDNMFSSGGTFFTVMRPRGAGSAALGRIIEKGSFSLRSGNGAILKLNLSIATSGTSYSWVTTNSDMVAGTVYVVVVTFKSSTLATPPSFYINSFTSKALTPTTGSGTASSENAITYIGNVSGVNRTADAQIATFGFYKSILTTAQINQLLSYLGRIYGVTISA
jgi:hypothetical protein